MLKYLVNCERQIAESGLPLNDFLRALSNRCLSHSAKSKRFPFMSVRALGVALLDVFKCQVQYFQSIARSFVKTPGRGVLFAKIKNVGGVLYSSGSQGLAFPART